MTLHILGPVEMDQNNIRLILQNYSCNMKQLSPAQSIFLLKQSYMAVSVVTMGIL